MGVGALHHLHERRFEILKQKDITEQVVNALEIDSRRRRRLVTQSDSLRKYRSFVKPVLINFNGAKGEAFNYRSSA
jgi:hypothetical protein